MPRTPSKKYWNNRFDILASKEFSKSEEYYKELEKEYEKASSKVQKDLSAWYQRFANNNEISMQDARKLLNSNELEEFKWTVEEYIQKGKTLNYSQQWAKQLENASAKMHVSRLEAIQLQMQNHVESLYGSELKGMTKILSDIYADGYYRTAFEIQKGFGVGTTFHKLDRKSIEKVITTPWSADGSNFSERIWKQRAQLVNDLRTGLTQTIIRGQSPSVLIDSFAKKFDVSKRRAGTLLMTESAFIASACEKDAYNELGVKEFEVLATLDTLTSEICRGMDGQHFPISQYEIGVTAPPFHPNCRTTTVPYFDDEFTFNEQRAGRNSDGSGYYTVPSDMQYYEWKSLFVDGGDKSHLAKLDWKKYNIGGYARRYPNEPDALSDVPMFNVSNTTLEERVAMVNPKYDPSVVDYSHNCQRTVPTMELVERGYNVTAKPVNYSDTIGTNGIACYDLGNTPWFNHKNIHFTTKRTFKDDVEKLFDTDGSSARYQIRIHWNTKRGGGSHFIYCVKQNGEIKLIDPQTNEFNDFKYYIDAMAQSQKSNWILRVDDLEFNETVALACEER